MADSLGSGGLMRGRRGASAVLAFLPAVLVALVVVLVAPAVSHAATTYQHSGAFGGSGSADGLFLANPMPQRIAVHQASGKLFVADSGNNRVQVFSPAPGGATFAFSIPTPQPQGVAIDQVNGDLYVVNRPVSPNPGRVTKFNPDSSSDPTAYLQDLMFISPIQGSGTGQVGSFATGSGPNTYRGGIAVDPVTRNILVVDTSKNQLHRYTSFGAHVSSFDGASASPARAEFNQLMDVAVGPNGEVIVSDFTFESGASPLFVPRIDRYNAAGQLQATLSNRGHNQITMTSAQSFMAVGVDPESGEVFAASQIGDGFIVPIAPGRIYQFEDDALVRDFGIAGTGLNGYKSGIAVRSDPGRLYVLSSDNANQFALPGIPRVQAFDEVVPPSVAIDPVGSAGLTARSATVSGTINPNNQQTSWRVQYRKAGVVGWPNQTALAPVGNGATDVEVETQLEGLDPFTNYEARIAASTTGGAEAFTGPVSFKTLRDNPQIGLVTASFLDSDGAEIRAEINPLSAPTRYWVEYGTSDSYGSRQPAEPDSSDAGSAGTASIKVQPLTGLDPVTTYHYKVVAENDAGMRSESGDHTFTTLPDGRGGLQGQRGYELATKQPMGFAVFASTVAAADHGDSLIYGATSTDSPFPGYDRAYRRMLAVRGGSAWGFRPVDLPDPGHVAWRNDVYFSADLSRAFAVTRVGYDPNDQNGVRDLYLNVPGGDPVWISRSETIPAGEPQTDTALAGSLATVAAPDGGAVAEDAPAIAFGSKKPLTADDPNPSDYTGARGDFGGAGVRLYKWKEGELTLISVRPDGSTPVGPSVKLGGSIPAISGVTSGGPNSPHAMSADGDRVFWSDGTSVFVHLEGEERSRLVGNGLYVDALPDGSRAFFTSGGRMYSYDVATTVTRDLTGAAQVVGPVAVAETGERVYFLGRAALDVETSPRGLRPVAGSLNLYVTTLDGDGDPVGTRLIAVLPEDDVSAVAIPILQERAAVVSPDGRVLAFGSQASLTGQPTAAGGKKQAFVYDDEARSLVCVSCPADGSVPQPWSVNGVIGGGGIENGTLDSWQSGMTAKRLVSSDGTVFFDTRTPLVAGDENLARDVYEYRNGELRLLTTGRADAGPSVVGGASADGSTVFVVSGEQYDPRDIEPGFRKVWALRVGGGYEYNGPSPGCSGQGCDGDLQVVPEVPPIGSDGLRGQGNLVDERAASKVALAVRQAKGGRGVTVSVRVTAPGAGRITVTGKDVRKATRKTSRAGGYTIKVRLSGSSSRTLARRGALSARVKVSFKPRAGKAQAKRLKLKFKQPSTRKGARR